MKVKLKTYKYNGTLKAEFSSVQEAQRFVDIMANKFPDMRFEPYIEQEERGEHNLPNSELEETTQTQKESRPSFLERLSELFENEE